MIGLLMALVACAPCADVFPIGCEPGVDANCKQIARTPVVQSCYPAVDWIFGDPFDDPPRAPADGVVVWWRREGEVAWRTPRLVPMVEVNVEGAGGWFWAQSGIEFSGPPTKTLRGYPMPVHRYIVAESGVVVHVAVGTYADGVGWALPAAECGESAPPPGTCPVSGELPDELCYIRICWPPVWPEQCP